MKGGKLLGSGTYGCVFDKPFTCKNDQKFKEGVGKVFKNKQSANEEFKETASFLEFDPKQEFTNPSLGKCSVTDAVVKSDIDYSKCNIIQKKSQDYEQIVYKDTGVDMEIYALKNKFDYTVVKGFVNVLKGLISLQKFKRVHRDIKPPNMLITDQSNMLLIDFGLMCKYDKIYNVLESDFTLEYDYYIFPPEFKLYKYIYNVFIQLQKKPGLETKKEAFDKLLNFCKSSNWAKGYTYIQNDKSFNVSKANMLKQFVGFCKNLEDDFKNMYNPYIYNKYRELKDIFDVHCNKVDVFSISMAMWKIYEMCDKKHISKQLGDDFTSILQKGIHCNPILRCDMESLHTDMVRFLKKMDKTTNDKTNTKDFIKSQTSDVNKKDLTPSPKQYTAKSSFNATSLSSTKTNCMDAYTLQELKDFIKGKKQYKGFYKLNKKELCEKISNDLQMRANYDKVKPGPKKQKK
jgi:serine/threonine protein kinase